MNVKKSKIELILSDITTMEVDAIVNAAKESLLGRGGVDGSINRAAGQELLKERQTLGGCNTGHAKITNGYNLKAKFVIHTVGPIRRDGAKGEPQLLASCYRNCLKLAVENIIQNIAFPSISTGVYGYPILKASQIAVREVNNFLANNSLIKHVSFVCFSSEDLYVYKSLLQ